MARDTFAPWAEIVVDAPVMTAEELAALPDDDPWKYELVEGRRVWILWPRRQSVDVWRAGSSEPSATLTVEDELDGLDVVPGFRYRVADVFAGPRKAP